MPVTIQVAKHPAKPVAEGVFRPTQYYTEVRSDAGLTSQQVLAKLGAKNASDIGAILETATGPQTSLTDAKLSEGGRQFSVQDHGLVRAAYYAYSNHHHLVLRPEDLWFAILTQFSFFVNAHAEELRSSFVAHEGKKGLIIKDPGQPDMGLVCRNMVKLIDENIVDKALRAWILPAFSTTTQDDEVVAAVIMMGTLQKYFDYVFDMSCCGIPSVTLLGEQADWEAIQQRIEKLTEYGDEPTRFCGMLRPILAGILASFTSPAADASVADFWSRIVDRMGGSGMDYLTGWITALCFWDEDGKCQVRAGGEHDHAVDFKNVPRGFVSVPVAYISPGNVTIETKLLAGFVGFDATAAPGASPPPPPQQQQQQALDTLRPLIGWWMYRVAAAAKSHNTGRHGRAYLEDMYANSWNGQASTGYVHADGETVTVEDGLPSEERMAQIRRGY